MKKPIKHVVILTEILVLAGLAVLMLMIGFQDWTQSSSASAPIFQENKAMVETEIPSQPIAFLEDSENTRVSSGEGNTQDEPAGLNETQTPTPTPIDCGPFEGWMIYTVQDGDTLAFLLESTGAALPDFQRANCLGESTVVLPGMSVYLPAGPERPTATLKPTSTPDPVENNEPILVPSTPTLTLSPTPVPSETPKEGRSFTDWVKISVGRVNDFVVRPGTGWQYYWSSPRVNTVPQTVAYGERDKMSWNILNPAEGVYNWAPIDNQMAKAVSRGEQFSFRVYTSAGSNKVPQWALNAGVKIYSNGEIDYSNCVYQEKWAKFVNALVNRYDGNPKIAFIDISGYSDYNEWAWEEQTEWDYLWSSRYEAGTASAATMSTMDSYARRRLADMFIGGSFQGHQCKLSGGGTKNVNYSYQGFQQTQLVLPFAGIRQTTQYVFIRRTDVGFRHDGWGRENSNGIYESLWKELSTIWRNAPIVLETIPPSQFNVTYAKDQLAELHGSLVHNPKISFTDAEIIDLIGFAGYRYALLGAGYDSVVAPGDYLDVELTWRNIGSTPAYPKMGQTFKVYLYLTDLNNNIVKEMRLYSDVASWVPSHGSKDIAKGKLTPGTLFVPALSPGTYKLKVAIIHDWSGEPIGIDADLNVVNGLYQIGFVTVTAP